MICKIGRERQRQLPLHHHMKETFGYKTPEAWFAYLREWKEELAHPVTVKIKDIH